MVVRQVRIRGVPPEPGETLLRKVHATVGGLYRTGDLYLTSRRLVWVAHRLSRLLTLFLSDRQILIPLREIDECYPKAFSLLIEANGRTYRFSLYRWFTPLLWWRLTRRWAAAINEARRLPPS
jgi:hypothetical protein